MDIERNSKHSRRSNIFNRTDSQSYRSSFLSIERLSDHRPSLSKRVSLINAMDIELSNSGYQRGHDDLMIDEAGKRFSDFRRSSNKSRENYEFKADINEKDLNRKSNFKTKHQCNCQEQQCQEIHCICYLSPLEICVIGQCCPKCIQSKNEYLKSTRGYQLQRQKKQNEKSQQQNALLNLIKQKNCKNMHYFKQVYANDPNVKGLVFCTCKKSHCQKKYCLCFQKGIKCGQFCQCLQCLNQEEQQDSEQQQQQRRWERYATYKPYESSASEERVDQDIEQYIDQQMCQQAPQFNETMQFEPVNFDNILSNNNFM